MNSELATSKHLETGLAVLKHVVDALLLDKQVIVPYRDHPLTRLLRPALGGNCITHVLAFVSESDLGVARSTLSFTASMRGIVNHPKLNAVLVDKQSEARFILCQDCSCFSLYQTSSIPNLWIYRTVLPGDGIVLPGDGTPSVPTLWMYRTIFQGTDGFGIARDNCTCADYLPAEQAFTHFHFVHI